MKKLAILTCLKSNEVCTGAACLRAFNARQKSFEKYKYIEIELVAFAKCNGCDQPLAENRGLQEKLERLITIGTDIVHLGICVKNKEGTECKIITDFAKELEKNGIVVIRGTH